MRAVILNSGLGSRMGALTENRPKCLVPLADGRTILERQLEQLVRLGIDDVLITTGPFPGMIETWMREKFPAVKASFICNERYAETNYIYSLYLAREYLNTDVLLMHGDLVFEDRALRQVIDSDRSCMVCDTSLPLPEKDFKAVIKGERIEKIGIEFFESACSAQPLYKILQDDLEVWVNEIAAFCKDGTVKVYAENAFNAVSNRCKIYPLDIRGMLCGEVDNLQDLELINARLKV